jgi:hypothetical protein
MWLGSYVVLCQNVRYPQFYVTVRHYIDRVTVVDNTELPIESARAWQGAVRRTVAVCPDWVAATIGAVVAGKMSREI